MDILGFISWDVNPNIIESPIMIRYYGLLWAVSFFIGFYMVKRMLKNEGQNPELADKFLMYTLLGGVLGARLGHVLFYEPGYYFSNPVEIIKIWNGGLASHGGAIGIIISTWLLSKRVTKRKMLWSLDKIVVATAIAASLIRVGNLMNSEIIGAKSEADSAFFFENEAKNSIAYYYNADPEFVSIDQTDQQMEIEGFSYPLANVSVLTSAQNEEQATKMQQSFVSNTSSNIYSADDHYFGIESTPIITVTNQGVQISTLIGVIPRIPTQLWEAASYLIIFLLLLWGYAKKRWFEKEGLLFGLFLILLFSSRLIIEFWKEHQTVADDATLNMGQLLSLPAIIAGAIFVVLALRKNTKA